MNFHDKTEIIIDVREYEAPIPLVTIMENLSKMDYRKEFIKIIHRIEPRGLYPHLLKLGFDYLLIRDNNEYIVKIWKN